MYYFVWQVFDGLDDLLNILHKIDLDLYEVKQHDWKLIIIVN